MTFQDFELPKQLQASLDKANITAPTPIQIKSFKPILSGRDVMGIAQTGTGKTLAYLLPVLKQWKYSKTGIPTVLILVPTRELVVQVSEILQNLTEDMPTKVIGIYGGVNINTQKKNLSIGVDILVGTPGRTLDLAIDNAVSLREIKHLIVDEFDEMLNLGFRHQLTHLFEVMKPKRQNILFSATMTENVDEMLPVYFQSPIEISLAKSGTPLAKIEQSGFHAENFNTKINLLLELLKDPEMSKVLVFTNNKKHADYLYTKIEESLPDTFDVIHSNKSQNYRLRAMKNFEDQQVRGLITTDIMARGLDISDITHVINFEIPEVPEQYIHRIGRTGRADKTGSAIFFTTKKEQSNLIDIEILMNKELPIAPMPENVEVNPVKIESEKDVIHMKNTTTAPNIYEGGGAFHEKKDKNKKINLGGPTKRNPPKTKPSNRAHQKKKTQARKKK